MAGSSYWIETTAQTAYPALRGQVDADVAVVGGGIAGLCAAWEPARAGRRVVLLEADRIASATTGPSAELSHRWSAQDYTGTDKVAFVGRYPGGHEHLWVATGFAGWGMTNAVMAGHLPAARITGDGDPPWTELFDPGRMHPVVEAPKVVKTAMTAVKQLFGERVSPPELDSVDELAPGHGGIVKIDGDRC
ncbi:MAG: FAD-binding oxidoreductase [Catenulispora sp.]|nr:FAD-binding oxidoreductase [Catenulispora sp.]